MRITVEGLRTSIMDWRAARSIPKGELPALTPEQREVAGKLNVSEEDYARSALAGERTLEKLLTKTQRFGKLLEEKIKTKDRQATVEQVTLNTWEHRFEVEMRLNGNSLPLRVDENVVDDLFEGGSVDAEQRLSRILDLVFQGQGSE